MPQFLVNESYRIFDFHSNECVPPFDGRERAQESTWRFEGRVGNAPGDEAGWRLVAFV